MSKKKKIDVSGANETSFGSNAFADLSIGGELPAGPATIHESKESRQAKKAAERKKIRLDVKREKSGRGGKTVSVVYGASKLPADVRKDLLLKLKKRLATGGTLQGDTIEIQGDFVDRVVTEIDKLGYKAVKAGG